MRYDGIIVHTGNKTGVINFLENNFDILYNDLSISYSNARSYYSNLHSQQKYYGIKNFHWIYRKISNYELPLITSYSSIERTLVTITKFVYDLGTDSQCGVLLSYAPPL